MKLESVGKVVNFLLLRFALEVKCQRIRRGEGEINYFNLIKLFISPTPCAGKKKKKKSQLMMSNTLCLSRDGLLSDECVYGGRTDGVELRVLTRGALPS